MQPVPALPLQIHTCVRKTASPASGRAGKAGSHSAYLVLLCQYPHKTRSSRTYWQMYFSQAYFPGAGSVTLSQAVLSPHPVSSKTAAGLLQNAARPNLLLLHNHIHGPWHTQNPFSAPSPFPHLQYKLSHLSPETLPAPP